MVQDKRAHQRHTTTQQVHPPQHGLHNAALPMDHVPVVQGTVATVDIAAVTVALAVAAQEVEATLATAPLLPHDLKSAARRWSRKK